jgi:hypothetical protein
LHELWKEGIQNSAFSFSSEVLTLLVQHLVFIHAIVEQSSYEKGQTGVAVGPYSCRFQLITIRGYMIDPAHMNSDLRKLSELQEFGFTQGKIILVTFWFRLLMASLLLASKEVFFLQMYFMHFEQSEADTSVSVIFHSFLLLTLSIAKSKLKKHRNVVIYILTNPDKIRDIGSKLYIYIYVLLYKPCLRAQRSPTE